MKKAKNKFIHGAIILSIGGLITKIIGAIYRIPLTNILGAEGMGLYQLVFPMYALLLTISSSGLNIAVSRLVAERKHAGGTEAKSVFFSALVILGILGIIGSLFLLIFGGFIARVQGEANASGLYTAIAPAVLFVCLIAAFRGYFQGQQNMLPTATSQVVEQVIKMVLSLLLATYFMPNTVKAATGALWAVTISEAVALIYLYIVYKIRQKKDTQQRNETNADPKTPTTTPNDPAKTAKFAPKKYAKQLILLAVPFTLSGIMLPLSQLIDSALVLNILGKYLNNATSLFGLLSGPVNSLVALPVAVTLGFATAVVPSISRLRVKGDFVGAKKRAKEAIMLTLIISIIAAIAMFVLSKFCISFLYRRLTDEQTQIATNLLKISSISIIFLSLLSTLTSILQATGRIYAPVKNLAIAAVLKVVLNIVLLPRPEINIYGAALSTVACYFLASILDLFSLKKLWKTKKNQEEYAIINT